MVLLPITAAALRLLGFRRWQSALARLGTREQTRPGDPPGAPLERAYLTARMVRTAECHGLSRPNCLHQSLVLWWLLRRQGIACELRLGVRKQHGSVEAHAWVEHNGAVLNDNGNVRQHFVPFETTLAEPAQPQ